MDLKIFHLMELQRIETKSAMMRGRFIDNSASLTSQLVQQQHRAEVKDIFKMCLKNIFMVLISSFPNLFHYTFIIPSLIICYIEKTFFCIFEDHFFPCSLFKGGKDSKDDTNLWKYLDSLDSKINDNAQQASIVAPLHFILLVDQQLNILQVYPVHTGCLYKTVANTH